MKQSVSIIKDQKYFNKFCVKMNGTFGCKEAFSIHGECLTCPLWLAREVEYGMNEKGMTLGEALKASLRGAIPEEDALKIIGAYMKPKKEYPHGGSDDSPDKGR